MRNEHQHMHKFIEKHAKSAEGTVQEKLIQALVLNTIHRFYED
jgi:hypothetical protein